MADDLQNENKMKNLPWVGRSISKVLSLRSSESRYSRVRGLIQ